MLRPTTDHAKSSGYNKITALDERLTVSSSPCRLTFSIQFLISMLELPGSRIVFVILRYYKHKLWSNSVYLFCCNPKLKVDIFFRILSPRLSTKIILQLVVSRNHATSVSITLSTDWAGLQILITLNPAFSINLLHSPSSLS